MVYGYTTYGCLVTISSCMHKCIWYMHMAHMHTGIRISHVCCMSKCVWLFYSVEATCTLVMMIWWVDIHIPHMHHSYGCDRACRYTRDTHTLKHNRHSHLIHKRHSHFDSFESTPSLFMMMISWLDMHLPRTHTKHGCDSACRAITDILIFLNLLLLIAAGGGGEGAVGGVLVCARVVCMLLMLEQVIVSCCSLVSLSFCFLRLSTLPCHTLRPLLFPFICASRPFHTYPHILSLTHTHAHTQTRTHTRTHTHTHTHARAHTHTSISAFWPCLMHACTRIRAYAHAWLRV